MRPFPGPVRLVQVVLLVALLAPAAASATLAAGQAAAVRIDGDGLACAATVPVTLNDDGLGQVQLLVADAQRCTAFPTSWEDCRYNEGYRVSCRTPASRLVLTFEDELRVDLIVFGGRPAWHHLEGTVTVFGDAPAAPPPSVPSVP